MPRRQAVETAAIRFDIVDSASALSGVTDAVARSGGRIRALATVRRVDGDPPLAEVELEVEGVTEEALVAALEAGEIAGAGLDVFEDEPRVHPGLLGRDDVVLLPHVGSATVETRTAMADLAADNVLAVLAGEEPLTPVRE